MLRRTRLLAGVQTLAKTGATLAGLMKEWAAIKFYCE
jgi:hypothetical protein